MCIIVVVFYLLTIASCGLVDVLPQFRVCVSANTQDFYRFPSSVAFAFPLSKTGVWLSDGLPRYKKYPAGISYTLYSPPLLPPYIPYHHQVKLAITTKTVLHAFRYIFIFMCTQLGCIIIGAIVIIIVLSLLFAVVEVWNRSLESTDAHKIKAAVGILFAIVILICILLRTYLDNKRRDIKDIVNVVLFFTCWALLVWVCMCGLFSKKEECATEEIILLRNVAASRNDLVNLTRLNIQTNPLAGQPLESPANFPSSPRSVSPTVIRNNASPSHQRSIDRATIVTYENQIRVLRKQLRRYQYMLEGEPGGSGSSNTNFLGGGGAGISGSNVYSNRSLSGVDTNTGSSQLSFLSDNWDHYRDEKQRSNSFSGGCEGLFVFPTNHRIIHRSFPIKPWLSQRPPLEANNHSSNTIVPTNQMEPSLSLLNEAPSPSETEVPETLQTINTEESVGSPTSYDESMSSNTLGTIESKYSKQSYILI